MDQAAIESILSSQLRSLYASFTAENITAAINFALMELGWALPVPDSSHEQCLWTVKRIHRHLLDALRCEAAYKFDYKQAKLSNRFTQLDKAIAEMDRDFEAARRDNMSLFLGYRPIEGFGTYVSAGFSTDAAGRDRTYDADNAGPNFWGSGSKVIG